MGMADARIVEIMENEINSTDEMASIDCLTTELVASVPPQTPTAAQVNLICYVIDATTTPKSTDSIFRWTGTYWHSI